MDIKSPRRTPTTPTTRSSPQNKGDIRTPKQTRTTEEVRLSLMQARRTPIRSLNTSSVSVSTFCRNISKKENLPLKRCFSQEVLDLSRRQIVMGKKSKAEISHVPPKKIKMGDFTYTPKLKSPKKSHDRSRDNRISDKNDVRKTELKPPPQSQPRLPFAPLKNNPSPKKREKDGVGNQVAKATTFVKVNDKEVQRRTAAHFLVTVENFPLEIWRENNLDCRILREIIFQSRSRIVPVKTTRLADGRLTIELINPNDPQFFSRVSPKAKDVKLVDFLKLPFGLSFRILTGVLRWIVGK